MAGKKILIIKYETLQLTATARRLKTAGYEIAAAGDSFVVLQRLQMIIQTAMIPVIVLSARTPEGNQEAVLKGGAVAYLQKPVDTEVLLKAIAEALGISPSDPPPNQP